VPILVRTTLDVTGAALVIGGLLLLFGLGVALIAAGTLALYASWRGR
jgi:hypothetical protein